MKKVFVLAGMAIGCSSASSSGGTLAPGQVQADGPNAIPPPTEPSTGTTRPPVPPEGGGPFPGCPSIREESNTVLTGTADVRTRLVGMYRSCTGSGTGLEIRLHPDSENRLLWYVLDSRFVRVDSGMATAGWMHIGECDGASCSIMWHSDGLAQQIDPDRTMVIWSEPTAVVVKTSTGDGASWSEWLRVAD